MTRLRPCPFHLSILVFAALLLAPLFGAPTRVACLGDSITAGSGTRLREIDSYPAQLQRMMNSDQWLAKNFGVSGATLMNRADKPYQKQALFDEALAFQPEVVVIKLGTNDTKPQNWRFKDDFVSDYRDLIAKFRALPSHPRILICHPIVVIGEGNFGINTPALREELPLIDQVATSEHLELIDLQPTLAEHAELIPDHVHPNNEGTRLIAQAVYRAVTGHDFTGQLAPTLHGEWMGYAREDFESSGRAGFVVSPKTAAAGRPWIWRTEFFGHEPQADLALLERGWHVAYVNVQNLYGAPPALDAMDAFYDLVVRTYRLNTKVVLEGFSRGGLFAFNWAARRPERIASIYVDAPVLDFKSWPAGKGAGGGSPEDWKRCLQAYGLTEPEALAYAQNPVDNLKPLATAGIPILSVCGDADKTVPFQENTQLAATRYRELGGTFEVILKPGVDHHPHSLKDPTPIVTFVLKHAPAAATAGSTEDARPVVVDSKAVPETPENPALPTLFIIGDSTAKSDAPLRGWGAELSSYFDLAKINVVNRAIGGRSSRTFQTEGRWDKVLGELKPGDFVLIQFGHNDDGDYHDPSAKGRPSIRGDGDETAEAIKADLKTMEPIHTFGWYLRKYATDTRAHGATPILLTKVPHKDWKDGKIDRSHDLATFLPWTQNAARTTGSLYCDVNALISAGFERLGPENVEAFFGDRRTHSTPAGAHYNAAAVIAGLKTLPANPLERYFSPRANDLPPTLSQP